MFPTRLCDDEKIMVMGIKLTNIVVQVKECNNYDNEKK